ncbi:MAG: hypothetical protein J6B34_01460 [Clostridia bacterium]|nr:hypothetical protein [Clostridia bacterium]
MNISGIPEESFANTSLACCAYVRVGNEIVYLDGDVDGDGNQFGAQKTSATLRTYNEVLGLTEVVAVVPASNED